MRIYEELFIVRPDATDEEIDPLVEQLRGIDHQRRRKRGQGGQVGRSQAGLPGPEAERGLLRPRPVRRRSGAVKEIERRLRVSDLVLKFITVRIDEKMKRIAKRKKAREKRAARKPQMSSLPPSAPAAPASSGRARRCRSRSAHARSTCSRQHLRRQHRRRQHLAPAAPVDE